MREKSLRALPEREIIRNSEPRMWGVRVAATSAEKKRRRQPLLLLHTAPEIPKSSVRELESESSTPPRYTETSLSSNPRMAVVEVKVATPSSSSSDTLHRPVTWVRTSTSAAEWES